MYYSYVNNRQCEATMYYSYVNNRQCEATIEVLRITLAVRSGELPGTDARQTGPIIFYVVNTSE